MSEPQTALKFHSGSEFWSPLPAYEGGGKQKNLKIDVKLHFLRMKILTFKSHHKLTKRNLKKISPSGDAEFYFLSGAFIKFYAYVKETKKISPTDEAHRREF